MPAIDGQVHRHGFQDNQVFSVFRLRECLSNRCYCRSCFECMAIRTDTEFFVALRRRRKQVGLERVAEATRVSDTRQLMGGVILQYRSLDPFWKLSSTYV